MNVDTMHVTVIHLMSYIQYFLGQFIIYLHLCYEIIIVFISNFLKIQFLMSIPVLNFIFLSVFFFF